MKCYVLLVLLVMAKLINPYLENMSCAELKNSLLLSCSVFLCVGDFSCLWSGRTDHKRKFPAACNHERTLATASMKPNRNTVSHRLILRFFLFFRSASSASLFCNSSRLWSSISCNKVKTNNSITDKMVGSSWIGFTQYKKHAPILLFRYLSIFFFLVWFCVSRTLLEVVLKKNNWIFFYNQLQQTWHFFDQSGAKPKPIGTRLTRAIPRLACYCFEFWLAHQLVCICCDWQLIGRCDLV